MHEPHHTYFKPAGVRMGELADSVLTVDEYEAVRLKDLEGMEQEKKGECCPPHPSPARSRDDVHRVFYTTKRREAEQEAQRFPERPEGSVRYPCLRTTTVPHAGQTVSPPPSRG